MKMNTRQLALCGLLFSLALVLGLLEGWLAPLLGLPPGVKPGLSNIVVLYALLFLGRRPAAVLAVLKAVFALLARGAAAGLLSLSGGLLSLVVMAVLLLPKRRPGALLLSVAGALGHNAGQMLVVRLWLGPFSLYYAPILIISGAAMGSLTAVLLRALLPALRKAGLAGGGKANFPNFPGI
jgi:heptaprenyl diphosphate synthase